MYLSRHIRLLIPSTTWVIVGILFLTQCYAQEKPHREYRNATTYHKDGQTLKEKYQYYHDYWSEQSVKHGRYAEWDRKGVMLVDANYEENHLSGLEKIYQEGRLKKTTTWKSGIKEGKEKHFDRKARLRKEITFVQDQRSGLMKVWFPNGKVKVVKVYRKGKRDGVKIRYDRNGEVKKEGQYLDGKKVKKEKEEKVEPVA